MKCLKDYCYWSQNNLPTLLHIISGSIYLKSILLRLNFRKVPQRKVHLFTGCQLLQLIILCGFGFSPYPFIEMVNHKKSSKSLKKHQWCFSSDIPRGVLPISPYKTYINSTNNRLQVPGCVGWKTLDRKELPRSVKSLMLLKIPPIFTSTSFSFIQITYVSPLARFVRYHSLN